MLSPLRHPVVALRCFSLKFSLLFLLQLLSRLSSLKFLKVRRLFSRALSCSLSRCSSLIVKALFSKLTKFRGINAGCTKVSRQVNSPIRASNLHSRDSPAFSFLVSHTLPPESVRIDGRTLCQSRDNQTNFLKYGALPHAAKEPGYKRTR